MKIIKSDEAKKSIYDSMPNDILTADEMSEIVDYTIQKINNYPKEYGKTVENYFDLLFPDEVSCYLLRREINRQGEINMQRRGNPCAI